MPQTEPALKVAFLTLGCKLNQFESDAIASDFRAAGYQITEKPEGADICIINACTVTDSADRKSNNSLARIGRLPKGPGLRVLTGCFAPDSPALAQRAALEADGHTLVVDNSRKSHIRALVEAHLNGGELPQCTDSVFNFGLADQGFHTRGSIKIQDGCDSFCSYCIIPFARGPAQSRPATEIKDELIELCARGYREIGLTGVNMSGYRDGSTDFAGLIRMLLNIELPTGQDFRLRLGSMEPLELGPNFSQLFEHPRLCPSLHLCLQSGSDRILAAMKRSYSIAEFRRIIHQLRKIDPDFTISTDLITGYPGETEDDFAQSLGLITELTFSHVHVFPYSARQGTPAASLPDQVPPSLRSRRAETIRLADLSGRRHWLERFIGHTVEVLVEQIRLTSPAGHPAEIYLSGRTRHGCLVQSTLTAHQASALIRGTVSVTVSRLPTPAMAARQAELGEWVDLWNRALLLKIKGIYTPTSHNGEPSLVGSPE